MTRWLGRSKSRAKYAGQITSAVNNAGNINVIRCGRVKNQKVPNRKRTLVFAQFCPWPTDERMRGQQFTRRFQRIEKAVSRDRIQVEDMETDFLNVGVGIRRIAIGIHYPPRSR